MARNFGTVGVVGLGTMGAGIAEVFARSGREVVGFEPASDALERGRGHLQRSTDRAVSRGRLTSEAQAEMLSLVTFTTSMADLAACDLVIEAVPERMEIKRSIFGELDRICDPGTLLATNTSSLSVTEIAVSTNRAGRVIGMHFFNPAPVMKLVEIVRTVLTEPDVVADVEVLTQSLGKVDVTIADRAGFIANALLFGYLNSAARLLESGFASRDDIDAAMTLGAGLPMGPFALLDLIGLDTAAEILATMHRQTGDRLHVPAPTITQMVTAGLLGRKTVQGFYSYDGAAAAQPTTTIPLEGVVGVVGTSPAAQRLVSECGRAGVPVVAVNPDNGQISTEEYDRLAGCALVLVTADRSDEERVLFAAVDSLLPAGVVLAVTSTDGLVIERAAATKRPGDVIGVRLVRYAGAGVLEVAATIDTAAAARATGMALAAAVGLRGVECGDRAGGLVDALLLPYINDAVRMVGSGYADADDVDAAMRLGCGYPTGPLAMLDQIGLGVTARTLTAMHAESGEPGHVPAPLLRQLVAAGRLGQATGHGIRPYAST